MNRRTGAQILVDQLRIHGADTVFCVPGESYLAVLDALYDANSIGLVTCRQEGGATMMAEAYGKLTGRPGIAMVTRGPGATNASAGLHVAMQDSTPLILFIGQVGARHGGARGLPGDRLSPHVRPARKWVAEIDDRRAHSRIPQPRLPYRHQRPARPGGAGAAGGHADRSAADVADAQPYVPVETWPGAGADGAARARCCGARQAALPAARRQRLGRRRGRRASSASPPPTGLPVGCGFRRQDRFDNGHPCYAGDVGIGINPKLAAAHPRVRPADRRRPAARRDDHRRLHAPRHTDAEAAAGACPCRSRGARPGLSADAADQRDAARVRARRRRRCRRSSTRSGRRRPKTAHQDYLAFRKPPRSPGALQMGEIMLWLDAHLPADAIFANGAGNFATWVHRFHRYRRFGTQLAPTSGSMGYGFPAAVAAKIVHPDRAVICVAGDGDFLMTGQELATAVQRRRASSCCWSITACTARSACTRSATFPAASSAPTSTIPISRRWRAPTAPMARWSSAPRISPPPSSAPAPRACRRSWSCASIPRRSPSASRCPRSARRRWRPLRRGGAA